MSFTSPPLIYPTFEKKRVNSSSNDDTYPENVNYFSVTNYVLTFHCLKMSHRAHTCFQSNVVWGAPPPSEWGVHSDCIHPVTVWGGSGIIY